MKLSLNDVERFFSLAAHMAYDTRNKAILADFFETQMVKGIRPYNPAYMAKFFREITDIFQGIDEIAQAVDKIEEQAIDEAMPNNYEAL